MQTLSRTPRALSRFLSTLTLAVVAASANATIQPTMTVVAGSGAWGYVDGAAPSAQFRTPEEIALDSAGNVYVADYTNKVIRVVSTSGQVSTLAGNPGAGAQYDGTGTSAGFNGPWSIALDSSGNVYVSDVSIVRKITQSGVVTTLAGAKGTTGSQNGTGGSAMFGNISSIAVDQNGNVFVADTMNAEIRKITPTGVVTTLAGQLQTYGTTDGTGSGALFYGPSALTVGKDGNIYEVDGTTKSIRKVTQSGVVTTIAGPLSGVGTLYKIGLDNNGNIYVMDAGAIYKVTLSGKAIPVVTGLNSAMGFTFGSDGTLYVSDTNASVIRSLAPSCMGN